jgi:DNA-binding transcriptional LysR family regulator
MEQCGRMDLNQTLAFAMVVQSGSFTRAARALALPKSTVSRRVSELEERLGARLLQRTTRRLSLTDVGRVYYDHCRRILAEMQAAEASVADAQTGPRGLLRLTAPLGFDFLGPIMVEFLRLYPDVRLQTLCTDRLVNLVEEGFDLALRAGALADSSLVIRNLGRRRALLCASPHYLERRGLPTTPRAIERHDCVVFGSHPTAATWRLESGDESVELKLQPRLVVNDPDLLREAAVAGMGVTLIPAARCAGDVRRGRLRRVLPAWRSAELPIQAVYPSTRHLSPKVRAFIDLLDRRLDS